VQTLYNVIIVIKYLTCTKIIKESEKEHAY